MDRDRLLVFPSAAEAAAAAADRLADQANALAADQMKGKLIGLATGRTMDPVYRALLEREQARPGLFAGCHFAQLDEYVLAPDSPADSPADSPNGAAASQLFAEEIRQHFLARLTGGFGGFLALDGRSPDPAAEAAAHRARLEAAGGLAVQLLGIGINGHIGFNEPGTKKDSICRVVALADSTCIRAGLPAGSRAITLGIADILAAGEILLLATGEAKAAAVAAMINGPQSPDCPASLLRDHPNFCIVLDEQAASLAALS
jgi:glucosamine-6-phosphate deaminase